MPQFVMSRRAFAGAPVALTTVDMPQHEPSEPRRVVALGWISRNGEHITISGKLASSTDPAGW